MNNVAKAISGIFMRDFKKRFLTIMSFPLFFCLLFIVDSTVLPEYQTSDKIESIYKINPSSLSNDSYKYVTEKGFIFSTEGEKRIRTQEIELVLTPLFDIVKQVKSGTKKIKPNTGLQGVDGTLLMGVLILILICFAYILLKKKISENAKLNMIYFNIFIFIIWFWIFIVYVG